MAGNTVGGNYRTTLRAKMAAFDKLPAPVRAALANAVADWAPQPFVTAYRGGASVAYLLGVISHADQHELERRAHQRERRLGPYRGLATSIQEVSDASRVRRDNRR